MAASNQYPETFLFQVQPCVRSLFALHRARALFFIEPRFLKEKQPQKPHNKLEKAQMMLRENELNLELKLGGESDNPTSKGKP